MDNNNFNNRRKQDIQFGRLIEQVDNIEKSLNEFKTDISDELKTLAHHASKRWDSLNHYFGQMANKIDVKECLETKTTLDKKIHTHALYWKFTLGVLVAILSILKVIEVFRK